MLQMLQSSRSDVFCELAWESRCQPMGPVLEHLRGGRVYALKQLGEAEALPKSHV